MSVDEIGLTRDAARGAQARELLEHQLIGESFDGLQQAYYEAWLNSPPDDVSGRERLWQAAAIIGKVRSNLEEIASNGELAERNLREIAATPAANKR